MEDLAHAELVKALKLFATAKTEALAKHAEAKAAMWANILTALLVHKEHAHTLEARLSSNTETVKSAITEALKAAIQARK